MIESEHNYTGYRRCDTPEGCNGMGFKRIGAIGLGNCEYVRCPVCGGAGQTYIEVKETSAPAGQKTAGPSIFAQRQQNAPAAGADNAAINLDLFND